MTFEMRLRKALSAGNEAAQGEARRSARWRR